VRSPRRRDCGESASQLPAIDAGAVLAWVESPFQFLGALEAHSAGALGERLVVLPRQGVEPLSTTITEMHRLGLPPGVSVLPPGPAPTRRGGKLAIGDAFSGAVHRLLLQTSPYSVVLLDDGRSTRRVMDALVKPGVPLIRPHIVPSPPRALLARLAQAKLKRLAGRGRVRVVTALNLPESVVQAAIEAGITIQKHDFAWLRSLPGDAVPATDTVFLGTSLVANDLIAAEPYLNWVRGVAAQGAITYRAHRREDHRTLGPLSRCANVAIETGQVPVELSLRGMTAKHRVVTLPTTAVSTLRLITPEARIQEFAVPDSWWLEHVPTVARRHLVPDKGQPGPSDAPEGDGPAAGWVGLAPMDVAPGDLSSVRLT
jgi:hypothetical protein